MNGDQCQVTGEEAYQYLADLFSQLVPFERACWLDGNPLRQQVPTLMQKHCRAVDEVLLAMCRASNADEMADLIARLPDEVFYVFATRWVNRSAMLLQRLDQIEFVIPPAPANALLRTLVVSFVSEDLQP